MMFEIKQIHKLISVVSLLFTFSLATCYSDLSIKVGSNQHVTPVEETKIPPIKSVNSKSILTNTVFPTKTSLPTQTPTNTPTVQIPVKLGTPFPYPKEPITENNISKIQELAVYGTGQIKKMQFSFDNNFLAVQTSFNFFLFDIKNESKNQLFENLVVEDFAFITDQPQIILISDKQIQNWNYLTGELINSLDLTNVYQDENIQFTLSSNGKKIAVFKSILKDVNAFQSIRIQVYDLDKFILTNETIENNTIQNLVFSSDNQFLFLLLGGNVYSWNLTDESINFEFSTYSGGNSEPKFSENGELLAVFDSNRKIQIWNLKTGLQQNSVVSYVDSFQFTSDEEIMICSSDRWVLIYSIPEGKIIQEISRDDFNPITQVIVSPNLEWIALSDVEGNVKIIKKSNKYNLINIPGETFTKDDYNSSHFTSDGSYFWNGKLFSIREGKYLNSQLEILDQLSNPFGIFNFDNSIFASGKRSYDNQALEDNLLVELFYLNNGQVKKTANSKHNFVFDLALSSDDRYLAVISQFAEFGSVGRVDDPVSVVDIFSVESGVKMASWPINVEKIINYGVEIQFSTDNQYLVFSSTVDDTLSVVKVDNWELIYKIKLPYPHQLNTFTISPNSKKIAVGSAGENNLFIYDLSNGNLIDSIIFNNRFFVHDISFSPNADLLALVDTLDSAAIWSFEKEAYIFSLESDVGGIKFSSDGHYFVTTSKNDSAIHVWGINPLETN